MKPVIATYYLRDKDDGRIYSKIEATNITRCLMGICYSAIGWSSDMDFVLDWQFVADVYCKFDSCTHWNFYGERFDPETETSEGADSYYHLCGPECFTEHIRNMCFIWKVAEMVLTESYPDDTYRDIVRENYEVGGLAGRLVEMMLKDYVITKAED